MNGQLNYAYTILNVLSLSQPSTILVFFSRFDIAMIQRSVINRQSPFKYIAFAFLCLASHWSIGQEATSWGHAQSLSGETGKPILIEFKFEACAPCQQLYREVFQTEPLRSKIDSNFHVYFYDIHKENIGLEEHYNVDGYPTTIILDSELQVLSTINGYGGRLLYVERIFDAIDPNTDSVRDDVYNFKIPEEFSAYKEDIEVHRALIEHLYDNPDYSQGENADPLGVFEDFFYAEKQMDGLYVTVTATKLLYLDTPRDWFIDNAKQLREEYDADFIDNAYYMALHYDIITPQKLKGFKGLFKKSKKIAKKMTDYLGEDKVYQDSMYNREVFYVCKSFTSDISSMPELKEIKNKNILKLLEYQISDELIEDIYEELLHLTVNLRCNQDLITIIKTIESNSYYRGLPPFIEIQAIAYYRLKQEQETLNRIVEANNIAKEKNLHFRPIFSRLKANHALLATQHKCSPVF